MFKEECSFCVEALQEGNSEKVKQLSTKCTDDCPYLSLEGSLYRDIQEASAELFPNMFKEAMNVTYNK